MKRVLFLCLFFSAVIYADRVKLDNSSEASLFGRFYFVKGNEAQQASPIFRISPHQATQVERPAVKVFYNRYIVAAGSQQELKDTFSNNEFRRLINISAGWDDGDTFYIIHEKGKGFRGYTALQMKVLKPIIETAQKVTTGWELISRAQAKKLLNLSNYPYKDQFARVRTDASLSDGEKAFLSVRLEKVRAAQEKLLGTPVRSDEVVRIAFCASGGGYRSMICTLGSLLGAEESGLLDAVTYMSALSGSSWCLGSWVHSGLSLTEFKKRLVPALKTSLFEKNVDVAAIQRNILTKFAYNQPLSFIDIYGGLLSRKFRPVLDPRTDAAGLAYQDNVVRDGHLPYPIYTAIIGQGPYEWVEFTPHEVGGEYLRTFVPSWAFDRQFEQGVNRVSAPPVSFGYLMGIWGSALSSNMREILQEMGTTMEEPVKTVFATAVKNEAFARFRAVVADVWNMSYRMPKNIPLSEKKDVAILDAGVSSNIPVPPLLRKDRAVDLIIILDASLEIANGPEFKKLEKYLMPHNLHIPTLDYAALDKSICQVYGQPASDMPMVIYMPRIKNERYSKTFDPSALLKTNKSYLSTDNFAYSEAQVNELSGLTKFNMHDAHDTIVTTIKKIVDTKKMKKKK